MSMVEHTERLRAAARGLGCSRSEALALAVLIAGACAALVLLWSAARPGGWPAGAGDRWPVASDVAGASSPAELPLPSTQATPTPASGSVVHVSGLVANPGVYDLPAGGRVADALNAAGGTLPQARLDGLNLARVLADGEQVHVPGPDEEPPPQAGGPPADSAWLPDGRLDVNRATQAELEELPGIGPVLTGSEYTHAMLLAWRNRRSGWHSTPASP